MKHRLHSIFMAAALALLIANVASAITSFTNPNEFENAVLQYIQRTQANFDSFAPGSPVGAIGMMNIYSNGYASNGTDWLELTPVATDEYPAWSPSNTLGPDDPSGSQFLSGNGDSIRFSFSTPVFAFGIYLIGNPSPTGDPAIPFWRMRAANGKQILFTAYSDTTPYSTLGDGNDVYFLGVVSEQSSFNNVAVYSDNDPAAVFSFNIDNIVYASLPNEVSIIQAKSLASGYIRMRGIVTRVHGDRFNIETADRLSGIAVLGTGAVRGKEVSVMGSVGASIDHERVVQLSQILWQNESTPPGPFFMDSRSVGGSTQVGLQLGIPGSIGPNNIGLDGAICGRITAIASDHSWMSVDDGVNRPLPDGTGVMVLGQTEANLRRVGDFVNVRGSITQVRFKSTYLPAIRVASPKDILSIPVK